MTESFENQVANSFTPVYYVSGGETPGTGFATFGNFTPQINAIQQVFSPYQPPSPISYFRVQNQGFQTDSSTGAQFSVLRIDYLTLWNRDDGWSSGSCPVQLGIAAGLAGVAASEIIRELSSHPLDNERSIAIVAAPTTSPDTINTDPFAYRGYRFFMGAHEDNRYSDQSRILNIQGGVPAGAHLNLAFSRSKHAVYTFNPNGYPVVNPAIIVASYAAINADYAFFGNLTRYLALLYIADSAFFDCFAEKFQFPSVGGRFAEMRINVGEPDTPINNSGFIQDTELREKLE